MTARDDAIDLIRSDHSFGMLATIRTVDALLAQPDLLVRLAIESGALVDTGWRVFVNDPTRFGTRHFDDHHRATWCSSDGCTPLYALAPPTEGDT